MKKLKLLPSIMLLILCSVALIVGAYSANTGTNTLSGALVVGGAGCEVDIAVYKNTESAANLIASASSVTGRELNLGSVVFDASGATTASDVDMVDFIIKITNKSDTDIGVYFWDNDGSLPTTVGLSEILYGHHTINGRDVNNTTVSNVVDMEYSFYHQIPAYTESAGVKTYAYEYMHVYFRLNALSTTNVTFDYDIYLNIEQYNPSWELEDNSLTSGELSSNSTYNPGSASGFVKIPSGLENVPVYGNATANNANKDITHVVVPQGTGLSTANAFRNCSNLVVVTLPRTLTTIGNYAFYGCSGITSIDIPGNVTNINQYAFYNCSNISSVTLPSGLTSMGQYAFASCGSLTSITIPNSITTLGDRAFYNCSNLSSVTLPSGLTSIGQYAFSSCSNLSSITLPSGLTSIGQYAFSNCDSLTSITIPSSVTAFGSYAFSNCKKLSSVTLSNGLATLGTRAFSQCTGLASITIPGSVTTFGPSAFISCVNLSSVTLSNGLISIGDSAFYGCYKLVEVYNLTTLSIEKASSDNGWVGYNALDIYTSASAESKIIDEDGLRYYKQASDNYYLLGFAPGSTLTEITSMNSNTKQIYEYAFYGFTGTISITLPSTITTLGTSAFQYSDLTSITIPSSVTTWGEYVFDCCPRLSSVTFSNGLTRIGQYAFSNCTGLTSVTIPSSVTEIRSFAFSRCTNLASVTIEGDAGTPEMTIKNQAFGSCTSLTSIFIPSRVTKMQTKADGAYMSYASNSPFYGSSALTTIYCAVTLENKPSNFGSHWNFTANGTCATVNWGQTRP